jgi:hypothetical protein
MYTKGVPVFKTFGTNLIFVKYESFKTIVKLTTT